MFGRLLHRLRSGPSSAFAREVVDVPPFGEVLMLRGPADGGALPANAVFSALAAFGDGQMPYVGLLIDFHGVSYTFSSADLAALFSSIAASYRGMVAPCAVVMPPASAATLQALLDLTKLDSVTAFRVVSDSDAGWTHIRETFARQGSSLPVPPPR